MTGWDHPGEAIGREPAAAFPEARAEWHAAFAVMARVEGIDVRHPTAGQLLARRRAYEAETNWSPAHEAAAGIPVFNASAASPASAASSFRSGSTTSARKAEQSSLISVTDAARIDRLLAAAGAAISSATNSGRSTHSSGIPASTIATASLRSTPGSSAS